MKIKKVQSVCLILACVAATGLIGCGKTDETSKKHEASYEDQKGSSYAVPRVSAAVAGYLLENPGVTQEKVLDYLKNKAVDAGDKGYDLQFGWGYIE